MRITSSGSKYNLGKSGKGLIISLVIKSKASPKKLKRTKYSIGNVSKKDPSNIIREFDKLPYESYSKKRPKRETNDS